MSRLAAGDIDDDRTSTRNPALPPFTLASDQLTLSTGVGHHGNTVYPADRDGMFRLGAGLIAWHLDTHADPRQPARPDGPSELAELEHLIRDAVAHPSPATANAATPERPQ